jgi:CP family cyanate transporter-like MFS transporter
VHRGGLLLVGILLIASNLRPAITSVGPVLDTVRDQLNLSSGIASALVSVPLIAFAVVSPLAPWVARRMGMERSLGLGLALLAVGIGTRSLPWLPGLWIGTVLLGIAIAMMNVILPSLVKRDYPDRIGQVTGVYSAVQAAMAAIAAGLAVPIAGIAPSGWRLSLGIWAGLVLIALAVFAPQLRSRSMPEDVVPIVPGGRTREYRSPWTSALAWQVTAYMGLQSTVFYLLITWLPSIEQSDGIGAAAAGFHQLLLNGFGILGSLCVAWLVPRMRDQRFLAVASTVLLAGPIVGVLVDPSLDAVWISVGGLGSGVSFVLAITLFGLRTVHHGQTAALSGMAQSLGYLLAATGPILIGIIHDTTGSWTPALVIILFLLAAQVVAGFLAGRARVIG